MSASSHRPPPSHHQHHQPLNLDLDLDSYSAILVESRLRNDTEFLSDLACFYRLHSPSFGNFSNHFNPNSGGGASMELVTKFKQFVEMIESSIMRILKSFGLTMEAFEHSLALLVQEKRDDSAIALRDYLEDLTTFLPFCNIMERKCEELYGRDPSTAGSRSIVMSSSSSSSSSSSATAAATATSVRSDNYSAHVRVLWDIENVSIPKGLGGIDCVSKLSSFLETKMMHGPGVDYRVTAFFNPDTSCLSKRCIHELDKGGVELIWVSTKREDADRKIVLRISQDVTVLPKATTSFVLISSDQDFCQNMKVLRNSGFKVIVVHNVPKSAPTAKQWIQALTMSADESIEWRAIVGEGYDKAVGSGLGLGLGGTEESNILGNSSSEIVASPKLGAIIQDSSLAAIGNVKDNRPQNQHQPHNHHMKNKEKSRERDKDKSKEGLGGEVANIHAEEAHLEIGWLPCVCIRWKGAFGFLSVLRKDVILEYFNKSSQIGSSSVHVASGDATSSLRVLFESLLNDPKEGTTMTGGLVGVVGVVGDGIGAVSSDSSPTPQIGVSSLFRSGSNTNVNINSKGMGDLIASLNKDVTSDSLRVFCHYSCLRAPSSSSGDSNGYNSNGNNSSGGACSLRKDEAVYASLAFSAKGLRALSVLSVEDFGRANSKGDKLN